jgi:hypothetical protein
LDQPLAQSVHDESRVTVTEALQQGRDQNAEGEVEIAGTFVRVIFTIIILHVVRHVDFRHMVSGRGHTPACPVVWVKIADG